MIDMLIYVSGYIFLGVMATSLLVGSVLWVYERIPVVTAVAALEKACDKNEEARYNRVRQKTALDRWEALGFAGDPEPWGNDQVSFLTDKIEVSEFSGTSFQRRIAFETREFELLMDYLEEFGQ